MRMYAYEIGRMLALPHGAAETAPTAFSPPISNDRMSGKKRQQDAQHTDRTHARATAAVRNAKSLVQIEMTDISADVAGPAKPDHRVHVCAVHVNLAAVLMHDVAHFANSLFKHAVRRRIRDHQRRKFFVLFRFRPKIRHVDVSAFASVFTTTTFIPAITALAGLVPCADCGVRHTSRCFSPRI